MASKAKATSRSKVAVLQPITSPDKDPYMKETSRSYKKCQQTHTLQSLNLARQTKDIGVEEKLCLDKHRQEAREVRADLQRLSHARRLAHLEKQSWGDELDEADDDVMPGITNPYPIAFPGKENAFKDKRGRRLSAEFEDLEYNSSTGKLRAPRLRNNLRQGRVIPAASSPGLGGRRTSQTPAFRSKECYWVGEPEAIASVRRSKKPTVELQQHVLVNRGVVTGSAGKSKKISAVSPEGEGERRYFDDQSEPGMPHRIRVRDPTALGSAGVTRPRGSGRRRSVSNPDPVDLSLLQRSMSNLSGISDISTSSKSSMNTTRRGSQSPTVNKKGPSGSKRAAATGNKY